MQRWHQNDKNYIELWGKWQFQEIYSKIFIIQIFKKKFKKNCKKWPTNSKNWGNHKKMRKKMQKDVQRCTSLEKMRKKSAQKMWKQWRTHSPPGFWLNFLWAPVTSNSWDRPSTVPRRAVHRNTVLRGNDLSLVLYSVTPNCGEEKEWMFQRCPRQRRSAFGLILASWIWTKKNVSEQLTSMFGQNLGKKIFFSPY